MKEWEELEFDQIKELIEQKDAKAIKELLIDLLTRFRWSKELGVAMISAAISY